MNGRLSVDLQGVKDGSWTVVVTDQMMAVARRVFPFADDVAIAQLDVQGLDPVPRLESTDRARRGAEQGGRKGELRQHRGDAPDPSRTRGGGRWHPGRLVLERAVRRKFHNSSILPENS